MGAGDTDDKFVFVEVFAHEFLPGHDNIAFLTFDKFRVFGALEKDSRGDGEDVDIFEMLGIVATGFEVAARDFVSIAFGDLGHCGHA